jgi:hypothetical protein
MSAKDGIFKVGVRVLVLAGLALSTTAALGAEPVLEPVSAKVPVAPQKPPMPKVITPAQRCSALEKQFDEALKGTFDDRNLSAAKKLRSEGGHLCESGRHAAGALRLARALQEIGLEAEEP